MPHDSIWSLGKNGHCHFFFGYRLCRLVTSEWDRKRKEKSTGLDLGSGPYPVQFDVDLHVVEGGTVELEGGVGGHVGGPSAVDGGRRQFPHLVHERHAELELLARVAELGRADDVDRVGQLGDAVPLDGEAGVRVPRPGAVG